MKLTFILAALASTALALPPPVPRTDHHPLGLQELQALNATNSSTVGVEKVGDLPNTTDDAPAFARRDNKGQIEACIDDCKDHITLSHRIPLGPWAISAGQCKSDCESEEEKRKRGSEPWEDVQEELEKCFKQCKKEKIKWWMKMFLVPFLVQNKQCSEECEEEFGGKLLHG